MLKSLKPRGIWIVCFTRLTFLHYSLSDWPTRYGRFSDNLPVTRYPPTTPPDSELPIDLIDIGYDGTWKKFCDPEEIIDDYPYYPDHDLKRLRLLICKLRKDGKIDRESVPAFAGYKFCNMVRSTTDYFFEQLSDKFSDYDDTMKGELLAANELDKKKDGGCYNDTMKVFTKECIGPNHMCIRMFRDLMAQSCVMPWLTPEKMKTDIYDVCHGKFLSDDVDWDAVFLGIKYREPTTEK